MIIVKLKHAYKFRKTSVKQHFYLFIIRGEGGLDRRCLDTYAIVGGKSYFALEHYLRDLA